MQLLKHPAFRDHAADGWAGLYSMVGVKWTTARELVEGFFPGGSAYALEANAGVSVALGGAFSLRVLLGYSGTHYALEPSPGGTYQASGATDQYLGARATVRGEL